MKKKLCFLMFALFCFQAKADQLAYLSKDQAEMTVQFFKDYDLREVIIWCACCENDTPQKITVEKVFYRYTGTDEFYEVVIEGKDKNDNYFQETIDLAYVHIKSGLKANCLGKELGFECTPCTVPFTWNE